MVYIQANRSDDGFSVICPSIPTMFAGVPDTRNDFKVSLSLSFDLQELQWNQTIEYYRPPIINEIVPSRAT